MKKTTAMEFKPKSFINVPVNTFEYNHCSPPEQEPEWRGILIEAPEEAIFSASDSDRFLPVCGYYQIDIQKIKPSPPLKLSVLLKGEEKVFSGFLVEKDASPSVPEPFSTEIDETESKDMAIGSYFNPDLFSIVEFPLIPGEIELFAEYGGMKSNTVTIKLKF